MRNATAVLPFKTRRPTHRHYFLRVNFRPSSFFTRAKINPGVVCNMLLMVKGQHPDSLGLLSIGHWCYLMITHEK